MTFALASNTHGSSAPWNRAKNPSKSKEKFGWDPKPRFAELVRIMTEADWKLRPAGKAPQPTLEAVMNMRASRFAERIASLLRRGRAWPQKSIGRAHSNDSTSM